MRLSNAFQGAGNSIMSPPNIVAFKYSQHGAPGSILQSKYKLLQTQQEANLIETRVKQLKREEDKILRKTIEAKNEAKKIKEQQRISFEHHERMVQFKEKQKKDAEILYGKVQSSRAGSNKAYQAHKDQILRRNQQDY